MHEAHQGTEETDFSCKVGSYRPYSLLFNILSLPDQNLSSRPVFSCLVFAHHWFIVKFIGYYTLFCIFSLYILFFFIQMLGNTQKVCDQPSQKQSIWILFFEGIKLDISIVSCSPIKSLWQPSFVSVFQLKLKLKQFYLSAMKWSLRFIN
jgi:hypothetical protein